MEWLAHTQKKYCELCKTPFRFTKLYDKSMPETVPIPIFLHRIALHAGWSAISYVRYVLVTLLWTVCLPYFVRHVWRGLFWIADGSWMTTAEMQAYLHEYKAHTGDRAGTGGALNVTASSGPVHPFWTAYLKSVAGYFNVFDLARVSDLLGGFAGDVWHQHSLLTFQPASVIDGAQNTTSSLRSSSLLSEALALQSLDNYPMANGVLIDVVEGQLICLLIVAAFILIFLIREWVVGQQPAVDVPNPDQPNLPQPAIPIANPRPQQRQRRIRRPAAAAADIRLRNVVAAQEDQPAIPIVPVIRDVDNIMQPEDTEADRSDPVSRSESTIKSARDLPVKTGTQDNPCEASPACSHPTLDNEQHSDQSPVVASSSGTSDDKLASFSVLDPVVPSHTGMRHDSNGLFDPGTTPGHGEGEKSFLTEDRQSTQVFSLPESSSSRPGTEPSNFEASLPTGWSRRIDRHGKEYYRDENTKVSTSHFPLHDPSDASPLPLYWERRTTRDGRIFYKNHKTHERTWIRPRDVIAAPLPDTVEHARDLASSAASGDNDADAASIIANPDDSVSHHTVEAPDPSTSPQLDAPPEPRGVLGSVYDWLWWTDDYSPSTTTAAIQPHDNHALRDDNIQPQPVLDDVVGRLPPPVVRAEDPQPANVLNDDDAEDLEGLLELVGLEGPLIAMLQNLLFSIFLITMTLIGFIWCPYVWGKIFLLLVAHPYSVFVKAPMYVLSRSADLLVDGLLFTLGLLGLVLSQVFRVVVQALLPMVPGAGSTVDLQYAEGLFLSMSNKSGTRLEQVFSGSFLHLRPDLPTFSMQSHHVLRVLHGAVIRRTSALICQVITACIEVYTNFGWSTTFKVPVAVSAAIHDAPSNSIAAYTASTNWLKNLQIQLKPISFGDLDHIDYTLIEWTTKEKIVCVLLGYILGHIAGYVYLKVAHWYYGLEHDEEVDTFVADVLRQAGGVVKVVVIIGIEMIIFPLYCGLMLNVAMLPLFAGASIQSRMNFLSMSPITAVFVHWFLGTCYMFHFALFVAMCRKIFRKGVLYFVRDPDDPSFHPVRDVLERPVLTQLGRIIFSALVYGGLLIICLGSVVRAVDKIGGVLPIQWTSLEPVVTFPFDVIFYNFMLPFLVQKMDLSGKISALFTWWFRACASGLRLTDFLFGDNSEDEKQAAFVRWRSFTKRLLRRKTGTQVVKELEMDADDLTLMKHTRKSIMVEVLAGPITEEVIRGLFKPEQTITAVTLQPLQQRAFVRFKHSAYVTAIIESDLGSDITNSQGTFRISIIASPHAVRSLREKPIDNNAGTYVRAPAVDSVKIPKGTRVFLPVTEKNVRKDGLPDKDVGLHGRKDSQFTKVYVPSNFRARIATFICLVWLFITVTGLLSTVGPLVVGRMLIRRMFHIVDAPNDLYAFTVGVHVCGIAVYSLHKLITGWPSSLHKTKSVLAHTRELLPKLLKTTRYVLGLLYMFLAFGIALPLMISMVTDFYIHVPVATYLIRRVDLGARLASTEITSTDTTSLSSPNQATTATQSNSSSSPLNFTAPTIYLLQTWTIGFLYLRFLLRLVTKIEPGNRISHAVRSILRKGYLHPDIGLATRAVIIPITFLSVALFGLPLWLARIYIISARITAPEEQQGIYRLAYPAVLFVLTSAYLILRVRHSLSRWRIRVRDEVYLIGSRLHNLPRSETESEIKHKTSALSVERDRLRQDLRRRYHAGEMGQPDAPETIPSSSAPATLDARDEETVDLQLDTPTSTLDDTANASPHEAVHNKNSTVDTNSVSGDSSTGTGISGLYASWTPEVKDLLETTHREIMGQDLVRVMVGEEVNVEEREQDDKTRREHGEETGTL